MKRLSNSPSTSSPVHHPVLAVHHNVFPLSTTLFVCLTLSCHLPTHKFQLLSCFHLSILCYCPSQERARAAEGHTGPVLVVLRPPALAKALGTRSGRSSSNKATAITPTAVAASAASPAPHDDISTSLPAEAADPTEAAGQGHHHLVPVPLPLGSVRASLGALSTFEDCYALVRFLVTSFRNFTVNDEDLLLGVKMVSVRAGGRDECDQVKLWSVVTGACLWRWPDIDWVGTGGIRGWSVRYATQG